MAQTKGGTGAARGSLLNDRYKALVDEDERSLVEALKGLQVSDGRRWESLRRVSRLWMG